jgi:hypothetical protein
MAATVHGWYAEDVFETIAFLSTVAFATIFVVLFKMNRAQQNEDEGSSSK